ncbi:hypothetical protein Agabi119p4_266 [Agaricus bisporus var. burnettii]|uniref:Arrestin C-terminal-like domain-containing protein n=1 Tax=Agaricus bisporus var. burnettii TaxID=192524 RepID=A0A8H7FAF9_AGABI|nr:hypothetical protein Agabi119p4_266 [Agaricus bisporus var. burnettii]
MNTQNRSLEPGPKSNDGQMRGESQAPGQVTTPKKVARHQSFPVTSTSTITQDSTPAQQNQIKRRPPHRSSKSDTPRSGNQSLVNAGLSRHGTLLTANATPSRAAAELKSILGNKKARLKPKATLLRVDSGSAAFDHHVTLEQAKSRARIEVDIYLQSNVYVQGGYLQGHVIINVRPATSKEPPIFIVGGKIRVIGFESLGIKSRSIFYQCSATMSSIVPEFATLYAPEQEEEGLPQVKEGNYCLPFSLHLSLATKNGQARGYLRSVPGISLNYIAMVSIEIKDGSGRRSIAHFYRTIEVWPKLDPAVVLSPALRPLQATVSKSLARNPSGRRIKLTAMLYRLHWISGQSCRVKIVVENDTKKTLKDIIISLNQTITICPHSLSGKSEMDLDSRQPTVSSKRIAESVLEVGQPRTKGHASAKGWWLGVGPGQKLEFEHSILIPLGTLSVPLGQLFEVSHQVHVELGGPHVIEGTHVMLPIRIVGFLSVDPPPPKTPTSGLPNDLSLRSPYSRQGTESMTVTDTPACALPVDRPPPPSHLIHPNCRKEGRQPNSSNETLTVLESSSKSLPALPTKVTLRSTSKVPELGGLPLSGDAYGFVQKTAGTVKPDVTDAASPDPCLASDTVRAFEDEHLNDISDPDSVTSVLQSLMEQLAVLPSDHPSNEVQTTPRELDPNRRSRFATRVQEKTRLATAAYLNSGIDTGRFIQECQHDPTSPQGRHISRKPHLPPETLPDGGVKQSPKGPLAGRPSQLCQPSEHLSNPSDVQNFLIRGGQPGILVESNSNPGFEAVPCGLDSSPSGTTSRLQQGCPDSLMLRVSINSYEDVPHAQSETPTSQRKIAIGAPSTTSNVTATLVGSISVKDKVRTLEERVRAAAQA